MAWDYCGKKVSRREFFAGVGVDADNAFGVPAIDLAFLLGGKRPPLTGYSVRQEEWEFWQRIVKKLDSLDGRAAW